MINVEAEIFTKVATQLREQFPKIFVTGEYVPAPSSFPCVSIVEIDNATYQQGQTQASADIFAAVTYEVNVYSNKTIGKKTECKNIAAVVDEILLSMNFTRSMLEPIQNMADATIYRMLGRYRAVVDQNHTIYRR
jgi:hypothetical protein